MQKKLIILGGGPAGISAALTAVRRGINVRILSNNSESTGLFKARKIDNYPGLPEISGRDLLEGMKAHAETEGVCFDQCRIISIARSGGAFHLSDGTGIYDCGALIIAAGASGKSMYPGEEEYLGMGVSYCATCDGMLFRGRRVCVVGLTDTALHEAEFLQSIGCTVTFFTDGRTLPESPELNVIRAKQYEVQGADSVTALVADGVEYPCDGIFILRRNIAMTALMPGLELEDGHIKVDRTMRTNIDGVFAAGDCTGEPYQIAKAVGEGNVAALSADAYLSRR